MEEILSNLSYLMKDEYDALQWKTSHPKDCQNFFTGLSENTSSFFSIFLSSLLSKVALESKDVSPQKKVKKK